MELLERESFLTELRSLVRRSAAGEGRLVLLGGEAGVGKTSLVRQLSAQADGSLRVLIGACDALSTPRPLGPIEDIVSDVGGDLARLLREGARREEIFRAVLDELNRTAPPTLLVIEDVHWADESTLDLLRFLGRRIGTARGTVLATYRDDELVHCKLLLALRVGVNDFDRTLFRARSADLCAQADVEPLLPEVAQRLLCELLIRDREKIG